MNIFLIVVLVIIAIFAIRGWWKGLLRLLFSLIAVIVLIGLVSYATPHVSGFIKDHTGIYTMVEKRCAERIQSRLEQSIDGAMETEEETPALPLPNKVMEYLTDAGEETLAESGIYEVMGSKAADLVLSGVAFFVALIGAIVIVKIIDRALGIVDHIPVIKGINRGLGLIGGLVEAVIIISLLFMFLALISGSQLGQTAIASIEESSILSYFYYHNPVLRFLSLS